ncbi:MAG: hemerythrin domain-containing protein [Rhodospirillales bacterium]|nr:hemerythrin domain-containing protein [Rhodospirillales bacterium]MCW8862368.1 hemerythrin domain-containing protein [Rhodospirillales bacterium]MCW8952181.1 hemerythrin domain-containing protein [Rhodospirillales bacterium]MCW9001773.1 hemerythrin domain-containing protein [Rhodospirillales bacterium]MCW9040141.1 hemerythrin domain-containing protein [Rhodospirillales bacterium]
MKRSFTQVLLETGNGEPTLRGTVWQMGNKRIDDEHVGLILLLEDLSQAIENHADTAALSRQLDMVVEAHREHFANEEKFLRNAGYGDLERHAQEHVRLMKVIAEAARAISGMKNRVQMIGTIHELDHALLNHMIEYDMRYKAFIQDAGICDYDVWDRTPPNQPNF